jgi:hypothetical protein
MRRWIRDWLLRENNQPNSEAAINQLDTSVSPDISAYKISNGYLVRTSSRDYRIGEVRKDDLVFCKDHKEIADHLVTKITRDTLTGIGQQLELPLGGNIVGNTTLGGNPVRSGKL